MAATVGPATIPLSVTPLAPVTSKRTMVPSGIAVPPASRTVAVTLPWLPTGNAPAVCVRLTVGGAGVTGPAGNDSAPVPATLLAATLKVYAVPLVSPVTVAVVAVTVVEVTAVVPE